MGLFKKIKKTFKKVTKGIGKVFKKIGKAVGKVLKSPLGKLLMVAAVAYIGFAAATGTGIFSGAATTAGTGAAGAGSSVLGAEAAAGAASGVAGAGGAASGVTGMTTMAGSAAGGAAFDAGVMGVAGGLSNAAATGAAAGGLGTVGATTGGLLASSQLVAPSAIAASQGIGQSGGLINSLMQAGKGVLSDPLGSLGKAASWMNDNPVVTNLGANFLQGALTEDPREEYYKHLHDQWEQGNNFGRYPTVNPSGRQLTRDWGRRPYVDLNRYGGGV